MRSLHIAIFGFGTVGKSIFRILNTPSQYPITIKYIAVRNRKKIDKNIIQNTTTIFTENHDDIWNDPEIDCIIEVIGGTDIAKDIIYKAINTQRNVITANKAVLAEFGNEIFEHAQKNKVTIGFEASVAGGIPLIKTLQNHFSFGKISSIEGILNGTCNYILSELENNPNKNYTEVVQEAYEKGFAERDPSADVEGIDTASKLAILSTLCFHTPIPKTTDFPVTGISHISSHDISTAQKHNKKIRLIARATKQHDSVHLTVQPEEISENSPFYSVNGPDNMIIITHEYLGKIILQGAGAGGDATAMSVISDIINLL